MTIKSNKNSLTKFASSQHRICNGEAGGGN